jgi:hypothetical protein
MSTNTSPVTIESEQVLSIRRGFRGLAGSLLQRLQSERIPSDPVILAPLSTVFKKKSHPCVIVLPRRLRLPI